MTLDCASGKDAILRSVRRGQLRRYLNTKTIATLMDLTTETIRNAGRQAKWDCCRRKRELFWALQDVEKHYSRAWTEIQIHAAVDLHTKYAELWH
jgi:hypothetical protein